MLREYLKSLADKFREVLGYSESAVINAQEFADWIEMTCSMKYGEGYETGFLEGEKEGQASMVDENKIIEKTVKSTGSVIVNDVSQINHDLKVKLSSPPEGTSFENISITQFKNNLAPSFYRRSNLVIITEKNIKVKPNTDYTVKIPKHEAMGQFYVHLVQDAKNAVQLTVQNYDEIKRTFNTGNNTEIFLQVNCTGSSTEEAIVEAVELLNFNTQLELGNSVTEPTVVYANADGIVEGLKSESPITKLIADCSVNIELTYNRDWGMNHEYDNFWDMHQDYGNRELYNYGFRGYGWNSNNFYPKYNIIAKRDASLMFYNFSFGMPFSLKERLEECGVILDTSQVTIINQAFQWASKITELPTLDFTGLTQACNAVFADNSGLETIEKIITQESLTYNDWFRNTTALKNIDFEGEIGAPIINFTYCTLLTHESLMNIINHLKDFSGTTTTHTLAIGTTNQAKLTDGEKALVTEKGWTLT